MMCFKASVTANQWYSCTIYEAAPPPEQTKKLTKLLKNHPRLSLPAGNARTWNESPTASKCTVQHVVLLSA